MLDKDLRVLLTNSSLAGRTGSELYILDVARELLRTGHQPVCYSPILGDVAEEMHQSAIPVTDQLTSVQVRPDVIHGQHHLETLAALLYFPGVPAVQYCHGWSPWEEAPVEFPRIRQFIAIDHVGKERLTTRHGIDESKIVILPNFFDDRRFHMRKRPLRAKPLRALVFSNAFDAKAAPVRDACRRFGIALDVVGTGSANVHPKPELVLEEYDIVFARGRAAIEAMACGAAVICCGPQGTGPLITPRNYERLRDLNFGLRTVIGPCDADTIAEQIALYHPHEAAEVSAMVRVASTLNAAVSRLMGYYRQAIESNCATIPEEEARAVSIYLREWSPRYKSWAEKSRQVEHLAPANRELQFRADRLEAELADAQRQLGEIRGSLSWRIPQAMLNWRPMQRVADYALSGLAKWRRWTSTKHSS